jgi:hypothetical protein
MSRIWAGIDSGKGHHHGLALDADGDRGDVQEDRRDAFVVREPAEGHDRRARDDQSVRTYFLLDGKVV